MKHSITASIHPTAFIEEGARIGDHVTIGPYCIIHADVEIGEGTVLAPHVILYNHTKIGKNCYISSGTVISSDKHQLEMWENPLPNGKLTQVVIGDDVHIEPNCTLHGEIKLGNKVWLGSNVVVHHGARIGNNCKIHSGAVLSSIPQDLKFIGEESTLIIGDNTTVREFATLNRGTKYRGCTVIGSDCLIMSYVHVAHDCMIGNHCILVNAVNLAGHVEIDDFAVLGGMAAVHQFVKIGKHVMIGGGSLVTRDIPPYITAAREPIRFEGLNLTGLRRRNFSQESLATLQEIYRLLYHNGMNVSDALAHIEEVMPDSPEKQEVLSFCHQAKRGIVK